MSASDEWMRTENYSSAVLAGINHIESYGYEKVGPSFSDLASAMIVSQTAREEARAELRGFPNPSFRRHVIDALKDLEIKAQASFVLVEPVVHVPLVRAVEALWGIRVAFTHANGNVSLISNPTNRQYAMQAALVFDGVAINSNRIVLSPQVLHESTRTMEFLRQTLDPGIQLPV